MSYTAHEQIYIDNNDDFAIGSFGVVSGSGIISDPWIIEGWEIDASVGILIGEDWSYDGINIQNTTDYFIVRNCLVKNGGSDYNGIWLGTVTNGRVSNNEISGGPFSEGIAVVWGSSYNTIDNNICNGQLDMGISVLQSDYNTIENNICNENDYHGISLWQSSYNTLTGNTCSYNLHDGIHLTLSNTNTLNNNVCDHNVMRSGIYFDGAENNILSNNRCSNNYVIGIEGSGSDGNILIGNVCENAYNIYTDTCNGWTLTSNTCKNGTYGIYLWDSYSNTCTLNVLLNNTNNGWSEANNTWDNGSKGNYWSNWQSPDVTKDGIIDTQYTVPGGGAIDHYPLKAGWFGKVNGVLNPWKVNGVLTSYTAKVMGK